MNLARPEQWPPLALAEPKWHRIYEKALSSLAKIVLAASLYLESPVEWRR
jgi:hypothetical protein